MLIHFSFPGTFGRVVQLLARFGVPFFFMVSGYFCYKDGCEFTVQVAARKAFHIVKITIVAVTIYLIGNIAINGLNSITDELSLSNFAKLIVFNAPQVTSAHLWFLFALIYAFFLLALILKLLKRSKRRMKNWLIVMSVALLIIHLGVAYSFLITGVTIQSPQRNEADLCRT